MVKPQHLRLSPSKFLHFKLNDKAEFMFQAPFYVSLVFLIKLMQKSPVWNRIQANWKQIAGRVRQQWDKHMDDDIAQANSERKKLTGKIQERYGRPSKKPINRLMNGLTKLTFQ